MIKKREKMNNSALAQIETTTGSSRKFTQSQGNTGSNATSKIYSQKLEPAT